MWKQLPLLSLLSMSLVVFSVEHAAADPGKDESGQGKRGNYKEEYKRDNDGYEYEYKDGDCQYEYKEDKHGYKEERKCKGRRDHSWAPRHRPPVHRYPPDDTTMRPVPPAYGHLKQDDALQLGAMPLNLDTGQCNRELLGRLLGAAAGGLVGSQIGDGRGQLAAVAGGTLLGFLIGGSIGRGMDEVDQNCIGQAFEHAGDGQQITWNNPETGARYEVVPTRTVQQSNGSYCREYRTTAVIGGRPRNTYGRACRQPDGSWQHAN